MKGVLNLCCSAWQRTLGVRKRQIEGNETMCQIRLTSHSKSVESQQGEGGGGGGLSKPALGKLAWENKRYMSLSVVQL